MIRLQNDTGFCTETRFTDVDTGAEVRGVTKATFTFEADHFNVANLEIGMIKADVLGVPRFYALHPVTGKPGLVKSIEFENGERWTAPDNT